MQRRTKMLEYRDYFFFPIFKIKDIVFFNMKLRIWAVSRNIVKKTET